MTIRRLGGWTPKIAESAFVSEAAYVVGDVEIGNNCVIAAGSLIPPGSRIPDSSFVTGVPGEIVGKPTERQLWWTREGLDGYLQLMELYRKQGL